MKTKLLLFVAGAFTMMSFAVAGALAWKSDTIELGEIAHNVPKVVEFTFTNTGSSDIVVTNVRPSCGCTNAEFTKEAIKPGKTGTVKATYNAANVGPFTKTLTVTTSADENPITLTFKGTVKQ